MKRSLETEFDIGSVFGILFLAYSLLFCFISNILN